MGEIKIFDSELLVMEYLWGERPLPGRGSG